ncbi:MAG: arsenical pump-driving ATPase [Acidimicrobiales bacterium]|nr:arsenical pump-driving ATPase [Acidimicrobiales bacterium]
MEPQTTAPHLPVTPALEPIDWHAPATRHLLFTGKGGVGKTTVAAATAVALADQGRRVLIVSTDPASNLDDVLGTPLGQTPTPVHGVVGLDGVNIDPEAAAHDYRERTLAPFREVVPAADLASMEEQLAGQCTVEIAAFDEFSLLLGSEANASDYDHIVFDTAPTGHTLRLLSLPAAWSDYLVDSPAGASCLGPLAALEEKRQLYEGTVAALSDSTRTTVMLVSRPERSALREAARAASELAALGVENQRLIINGVLEHPAPDDAIATAYAHRQRAALDALPAPLDGLPGTRVPLSGIEITGAEALRHIIGGTGAPDQARFEPPSQVGGVHALVAELLEAGPGVTMVMGKGGVGKTTVAAAVAVGLARAGADVHLATTDPAGRFSDVLDDTDTSELEVTSIDPAAELQRYVDTKLRSARDLDPQQRALLEEDLRSPCTEEIAVFQAFAGVLRDGRRRHVVVDTAPSGHTLMLLDQTGAYHREVMRTSTDVGGRITTPLMRIQNPSFTRVVLVTLAESTPVQEASELQDDLRRADIEPYGWVVNASLSATGTTDGVLAQRAANERHHLERVQTELSSRTWLVPWLAEPDVDTVLGP